MTGPEDATVLPADTRLGVLIPVGAALAAACPLNLEVRLAAAEAVGGAEYEVMEIATLATFIRSKAATNVRRMVGRHESMALS
jgi:hypothetical protein